MEKKIFLLLAISTLLGLEASSANYIITTAAEWNALADYMAENNDSLTGDTVYIANDIDFEGDTIKALGYGRSEVFNGEIDGNGKTIKGFVAASDDSYFGALIINSYKQSSIHDLTVEGEVTTTNQYTGGIVGKFYGNMNNVLGKVNVTCTASKTYTAGIAAYTYSGSSMTDCINEGDITSASTSVAGLVAQSGSGVSGYYNCGNRGTITYTGTAQMYSVPVAGLIASCYGTTMSHCWNTGDVIGINDAGCASGLVGIISTTTSSPNMYMTGCYNTGDVTGFTAAGLFQGASVTCCLTMDSCYNTGCITSAATSSYTNCFTGGLSPAIPGNGTKITNSWNSGTVKSCGLPYTGGLFGYYRSTSTYYNSSNVAAISNCYNTGDVISESTDAGGIIGYQYQYVQIDNCYNTGAVQATSYAGGIAGRTDGAGAKITNSYNAGDVTATDQYAGGITGYSTHSDSIANCFNTGSVISASNYAGGIAGLSPSAICNVYNAGQVSGTSYVGGIIGATVAGSTSLHSAYSTGIVSATDTCGNIIGVSTENSDYWNEANSISDTYYLTVNAVENTDTVSTGLTYEELASLDFGSAWTAGDDYTYPRISSLADNDYAKAYAAAIIPDNGDTYASVTQNFYVGVPDGVTWSASPAYVTIDGNTAVFTQDYAGTLTMTATSGDVSVSTDLTCNIETTDINEVAADAARNVISEKIYNISGTQIAVPANNARNVYIVVKNFDDGTREIIREIR